MRASLHRAAPLALLGLPGVLAAGFYALRLIDHPVVFLQPAVLLLVSSLLGALLAHRSGLVSVLAQRAGADRLRSSVPMGVVSGALLAALLVAVDRLVFRPILPQFFEAMQVVAPGPFAAFLLGVTYGGVTEEIVMRWGVMSLLCWIGLRILPPAAAYWSAIALSALLFAAAHLPAALALGPLPDVLVLRIMLLNTLAGVVFGWLYWRYTLECAMIAHASVHAVFLFERLVL